MKPRVSAAHEVSACGTHQSPSQAPPCPKYCRDTRKNGVHHVFTSSTQLWSQCSLWGMLKLGHTVLDPELGGGVSLGLHIGSFPAPSGGKRCFHLRVLESFWALWHLESESSHFLPHRNGVWGGLGTGCGEGYGSIRPLVTRRKEGLSPGQAPVRDQGDGQRGSGVRSWRGCWEFLAGTRRQAQPDNGKAQSAITRRSCTVACV